MRRGGGGVDGAGRKRVGEHHGGSFGVYMSHKIQKLRGQNESLATAGGSSSAADRSAGVFQGVHVYVDGYTAPSKEEIRQLMLLHGGGFEHYDTGRVTHIVATHLPASKLLQLKKARKPLPVVHPDWIVQSIEQKKLLPVQPFLYAGFADPTQSSIFSLSGSASLSASVGKDSPALEASSKRSTDSPALEADAADHASQHGEQEGELDILAVEDEEEDELDVPVSPAPQATSEKSSTAGTTLRTNSTRDGPEFVRHFFAKSRLHHIGAWRATFQQKAAEFQAKYQGGSMTKASASSSDRVLLHVDMDCFFVAVAVRGRPELAKVPVAVAHSGKAGSSEISSCNYLARAKGVGAGMFMQTAKELCPELLVLPYQFDAIQRVSFQIYDIFFSHTPYVQAVSCDEAFLEFGRGTNGMEKAMTIRLEIFEQTGCPASVGVSYNVLLAKLSSKKAKPDGIYQIADPSQAEKFMLSLKIHDLPGAGYKTGAKLEALGVEDVRQLVSMTKGELVRSLGKASGEMLYNYARGLDVRSLSMDANMMRKSVSAVVNFGIRFEKWEDATVFLMALGEELSLRLRNLKVRTKCLTLLIKKRAEGAPIEPSKFMGHGVCDNFSKSHVLAQSTDDEIVIAKACIELLRQFNFPSEDLRGVGVQATKLISDVPSRNKRSGQVFQAWLIDPAQQPGNATSANVPQATTMGDQKECETKTEDEPRNDTNTNDFAATTFSQINMGVLEELPEQLQREILASYGRGAPSTTVVQSNRPPPPKRRPNGKAPLRRRHPARNIFDSKTNSRLARTAHASSGGDSGKEDALDDIRMSQVDSEVYHSLPFAIRREIDRYAKKRKPTSSVAPIPRSSAPSDKIVDQTVKRKPTPVVLPKIEDLFANLVESLQATVIAGGESDDEHPCSDTRAQSAAFDAIYSRILVEVENRTLDQALRMLRFVRRKCSSTTDPAALADLLKRGFNHVLNLVNQDIQRQFNGVLSMRLVSPL
ncbi:deoxycytidyl transferase [Phytophthora pseudosyringae]|uniref:DNA repair protein REV1 n=1 Tax=Phytophthora pseudosyringae TaxID=221518 RepID=A0A8T1VLN5_9STRA|nr:deoxycytidyl transferase [Phytophthora pseudosyringae]